MGNLEAVKYLTEKGADVEKPLNVNYEKSSRCGAGGCRFAWFGRHFAETNKESTCDGPEGQVPLKVVGLWGASRLGGSGAVTRPLQPAGSSTACL